MRVPRFKAICARSVDLTEIGGRYSEVQFGLPPFSMASKNSPGVGTVSASMETALFSSSADSGLSGDGCSSAKAEILGTKPTMLNWSHFRKKGISRSLSIGGRVSSPASMLKCPGPEISMFPGEDTLQNSICADFSLVEAGMTLDGEGSHEGARYRDAEAECAGSTGRCGAERPVERCRSPER